jgi:hypothetical protein
MGLDESGLKRKHARAKIWSILTELDPDFSRQSQFAWNEWSKTGHEMRDGRFENLEEYLATRALDCGAKSAIPLIHKALEL